MRWKTIATGRGDHGETRLATGLRISKSDALIAALGDLDELVSFLGVARAGTRNQVIAAAILELQKVLFDAGAELSGSSKTPRITQVTLSRMEKSALDLAERITLPGAFIIPGSVLAAAYLDVARAVARRLERHISGLFANGRITNSELLKWLNRLSDYLWLLARLEEEDAGRRDMAH